MGPIREVSLGDLGVSSEQIQLGVKALFDILRPLGFHSGWLDGNRPWESES